jgi:hypothetical protein
MTDIDVPAMAQAKLREALAGLEPSGLEPALVEAAFARIVTIPYTGDVDSYVAAIMSAAHDVISPVLQARIERYDRLLEVGRAEEERSAANAAAFAEKLRQFEAFRDYDTSDTIH